MLKKYWQYILILVTLLISTGVLISKLKYQEKLRNDTSSAATKREENQIPEKISIPKTYTVKSGDTLWGIAEKEYGSGFKYHDLISKNPGKTFKFKNGHEGLIFPGTVLIL